MAFWSAVSGGQPLRQYRWFIDFGGGGNLNGSVYTLKKCDKPKFKVGTIQHKYLNHYFNFPGRVEWQDIKLTFAGVRGTEDAGKKLYDILKSCNYILPTLATGITAAERKTLDRGMLIASIGTAVKITQIGAAGDEIERWTLTNPFFTDVDFGTLDYGSDEIVEVTCTLKYDSAALDHSGAGDT